METPTTQAASERWSERAPLAPGAMGNIHANRTEDCFRVLTPEKRHIICSLVTAGTSITNAAKYVELLPKTVERAISRGRSDVAASEEAAERGEELPLTAAALFALKIGKAQAAFAMNTQEKYRKAMDEDPRTAMAYLELLGRLHPNDYGRRQVMKVEQDTTVRITFVEKNGEEWQRGQSRASVYARPDEQRQLPPGPAETNDIIDAELSESASEDDNVF